MNQKVFLIPERSFLSIEFQKNCEATNIGDFSLRRIINNAVENYADQLEENLPVILLTIMIF